MKVGDYVAKIENKWQKHNPWMEFPDEPPVPLGMIISKGNMKFSWDVLEPSGRIISHRSKTLKVISESR
jgi:hypothetical protein